jgi:diguanylate cyclase (GGDEF)-like protein
MVSPIFGAEGEVVRLLSIGRDITEKRHAEQQIAYLAHHDPLTGLANRLLFRQTLEQALTCISHSGRLAVHCLDLDQFKGVNDTLGHPAGDALLRQVAERLRGCVRESDTIARLGGDEFAIIQTKLRRPEDAANLAQRVVEALGEAYDLDGQQVTVGTSVGIALAPDNGATPDEIVRNADIALYRAKADGRGTFCFFMSEMDGAVRLKQELKTGLRTALIRDELELHFQPLVELCSGEVTCFEALLRWRHPVRGLVSPVDFIPVAEETGMIAPLGEWALRAACREAIRWPPPIRVAVNLSPVQFRSHDLLRAVTGALAESGLAAERLELEITETVLLRDDNLAILHQLRGLGVRIALDDFGTGYSALGYLRRFPFDKIKIDRSFVTDLPDREEANAIARAILGLGRSLGIAVAAEGVETARQLAALRSEECGEAQGYFFSRPVPAGEVLAVIGRLQRAGNPVA